jgi:uncharacterized lipoprotein
MKSTFLLISLFSFVTACSTIPNHMVVSPELIGNSKGIYFDNKVQLSVIDQRTNKYVIQITEENKPVTLLSSQKPLSQIITQSITPVLHKQGLKINSFANKHLEIVIDTALISVKQNLLNYTAKNTILLKAIVKNGETKLTKNFTITGNSKGPLTADIAVLERDFNNQLASTLLRITNNIEVQNAIKSSGNTL